MLLIADLSLPLPEMGAFGQFLLSLAALGTVVLLSLKIYLSGKEAFGRRPPLNKELSRLAKEQAELDLRVARCVTTSDLQKMEKELLDKIGLCLSVENFSSYKEERKADFDRLNQSIANLISTVSEYSRVSYNGRRALHKQCNAHSDALNYLAGVVDRGGDRVREIIQRSRAEEGPSEGI